MKRIKFGNWQIVEEGIKWDGDIEYFIPRNELLDTVDGSQGEIYEWLTHMARKTWLNEGDVYALNSAFIYATKYFGVDLNFETLIFTLTDQYKISNEDLDDN